ncbi:MAG TPA: hypothetical protein EYQ86_07280 [Bacteroidetes bacterium]|nr:hypothetical protein [Bacteroidota bacterium]
MQGHVMEWLNLIIRWAHVIFGIMWIGASFYFIFLENSLNRTDDVRDDLAGNLWAIHGGGFYFLEKYKIAPKVLPRSLHWFKYEAYFTWITGFLLLIVVYYMNAKVYMIDRDVADISEGVAIMISVSSMIIGWFVYDFMCKSFLIKHGLVFGIVGFAIAAAFSWGYAEVFNARAAYIHVGALLGTIMVGNVFMGIIPSQKALVRAAQEKKPLDPELGKNAGLRSLHNNYITFPVLFIMISNHFPSTFGHSYNWLILAGISAASIVLRHYINVLEKGKNMAYLVPIVIISFIALLFVTAPDEGASSGASAEADKVSFGEARSIINTHCLGCHSEYPTDDQYKIAPKGVVFDLPEHILSRADEIQKQSVNSKIMPMGNKSKMTDEEREKLGLWISQGAKLK